jgi:3-deoxy-D-manno-octulosonic-acid transferase
MYLLYSILLGAGAVVSAPYWLIKALRERKYVQNFRQRLGWGIDGGRRLPDRPLWIHAVSVGEVLAAKPLISAIRSARPDVPVVVSTVTLTGQALARNELIGHEAVIYFPFDWSFSVRRCLDAVRPRAVILLETELWPNFLRNCHLRSIPVFLVNGRVSDRSYRRYRRVPGLTRSMLAHLTAIGVQTADDRRKLADLGAGEGQVRLTGNLKYDYSPPALDPGCEWMEKIGAALQLGPETPLIVVGSSMKGEEGLFLNAYLQVRESVPGVKMVIAPRHPERFDEVAELLAATVTRFARRTQLRPGLSCDVLLLDTIGELRSVYSLGSVAVIGGSFQPFGGHNLLEPAALGKPIVIGPEMSNFHEMARLFVREQAVRQTSAAQLTAALADLLENPRARAALGARAIQTVRRNQGATGSTLAFVLPHLD